MSYDGSRSELQRQQAEGMVMRVPAARDEEAVVVVDDVAPVPVVAAAAAASAAEEEDSAVSSSERQRRLFRKANMTADSFREALYRLQENGGRGPIRSLRLTVSPSSSSSSSGDAGVVVRASFDTSTANQAVVRRMAEAEEMGLDRNSPHVFRQFVDLLEQTAELRRVGFACDFRDDTMCDEDDAARLFRHVLPSHPTLGSIQISNATFPWRTYGSSRRRAIAPLSRRAAAPFAAAAARA
jgi:hypothetical protein